MFQFLSTSYTCRVSQVVSKQVSTQEHEIIKFISQYLLLGCTHDHGISLVRHNSPRHRFK